MHSSANSFLHAMVEIEALDRESLLDLLEKPWKWEPEYAAWQANGRPVAPGDAGYLAFASAVLDPAGSRS